ncbi:hypothetical protein MCOR12_007471 [Pyricularia oryzae]|nr:hypothetical protein MCOR01_011027 [Pyricularia oryzae]KAI6561988.1 hypothetical protein MCOR09_007935 [Pyricularia oryzae]KAI6592985.1 hypothetical protein MCOR12_007471 [Pyricularia oryzae]
MYQWYMQNQNIYHPYTQPGWLKRIVQLGVPDASRRAKNRWIPQESERYDQDTKSPDLPPVEPKGHYSPLFPCHGKSSRAKTYCSSLRMSVYAVLIQIGHARVFHSSRVCPRMDHQSTRTGECGHKTWTRIYLFYLHVAVKLRGADAIEARLQRALQQQSNSGDMTLSSSDRTLLNIFGDYMLERLCRLNPTDEWADGYERFLARLPGHIGRHGIDEDTLRFCKWLYSTLADLHIIEQLPEGVPYLSPQDLQVLTSDHLMAPWSSSSPESPDGATAAASMPAGVSVNVRGSLGDEEEDEYLTGFTSVADSSASAITSPFGSSTGLSRLSTPSTQWASLRPVATTATTPANNTTRQPEHELGNDGGRRDRGAQHQQQHIVAQEPSGLVRPLPPVGHRVDLPAWNTRGGGRAGDYPNAQRGSLSYSFVPYSSMPAVAPELDPPPRGAYPPSYFRYDRPLSPPSLARFDSVLGRMLPGSFPAPYYPSMSPTPPAYFT